MITGASSPLGTKTIEDLLATGEYHVIGAYANTADVQAAADSNENLTPILCDLESFDSVRSFCTDVHAFRGTKTLDRLVCQAGITCDTSGDNNPLFTQDGHEKTAQVNFLSNFLLTSQLLEGMIDSLEARVTMVGNTNNVEIANLANLQGLKAGFQSPIAMLDGSTEFKPAKACADSVLCQKLLVNYMHTKYHKLTGVVFNSFEPGTGDDASKVVLDGSGGQSGISLVLKDNALVEDNSLSELFQQKAYDIDAAFNLFELCKDLTNTDWPAIKQVTSPCPTLKVIGAITKGKVKREELKRMQQGRPGISEPVEETKKQITKRQRVGGLADKAVRTVLGQTVGRVARFVGKRMLGKVPEMALQGSYDTTDGGEDVAVVTDEDVEEIQAYISDELLKEKKGQKFGDKSKFTDRHSSCYTFPSAPF